MNKSLRFSLFIIFFSFCACKKDNADAAGAGKGTCSDGLLNQNETAIDCGGVCTKCPTCNDGLQNQGETGIDCGGPCEKCKTTYSYYGLHGRNILTEDTITIISGGDPKNSPIIRSYSIMADIPEKTNLTVVITGQQSSGDAMWYYIPGSVQGWEIENFNYATTSQKFTVNFPVKCDVRIYFSGAGWAIIDIYENNATTPTRRKSITWKP